MKAVIETAEDGMIVVTSWPGQEGDIPRTYVFEDKNEADDKYTRLETLLRVFNFLVGPDGFGEQPSKHDDTVNLVIKLQKEEDNGSEEN